jgi:hypothetical protein
VMDRNLEACWGDVANEQLVDRTKELLEHAFKGQILCMMIMNQVCKRI